MRISKTHWQWDYLKDDDACWIELFAVCSACEQNSARVLGYNRTGDVNLEFPFVGKREKDKKCTMIEGHVTEGDCRRRDELLRHTRIHWLNSCDAVEMNVHHCTVCPGVVLSRTVKKAWTLVMMQKSSIGQLWNVYSSPLHWSTYGMTGQPPFGRSSRQLPQMVL